MMDSAVKARLNAAGFRETSVEELLGLTDEEKELIETRLALSRLLKELRMKANLSQAALAKRLGSEQGNVSRAERGDETLSLDWMIRAAYALGADRRQIGQALCQ